MGLDLAGRRDNNELKAAGGLQTGALSSLRIPTSPFDVAVSCKLVSWMLWGFNMKHREAEFGFVHIQVLVALCCPSKGNWFAATTPNGIQTHVQNT